MLDADIMTISDDIDELQGKVWSLIIPANTINKYINKLVSMWIHADTKYLFKFA